MSEVHPEQASPAHAEAAFGFLCDLEFELVERHVTGGNSFSDGWRLTYESPSLRVSVKYLDAQLEIHFTRGELTAEYLFIDREVFARHSGLGDSMFPPQKLAPIVDRLASDIRDNYGSILAGDDRVWAHIRRLLDAPPTEVRRLP